MIFFVLIVGMVVVISALRNTQGELGSALATDVPGFFVWAAAIFAVGAIGWIPGLKPVSRALLALVLVVLILRNYQPILAGFQSGWSQLPATGGTSQPSGGISSGSSSGGLGGVFSDFGGSGGSSGGGIGGSGISYGQVAEIAAIAAA